MPDTVEAFVASFRFDTNTGSRINPHSDAPGLTPPIPWGPGFKSTHFQWEADNPTNGGVSTQTTDPLQVGASVGKPGQRPANGNLFTISVVGYIAEASITDAIVQVSAYTTSDDTKQGTITFIDPPFTSAIWGPFTSNPARVPLPNRGSASMVSCTVPANLPSPLTLSSPAGQDEQGASLYECPVIAFVFNNNLRGLVASRGKIFIDVAIYFTLDSAPCFDDPEMEIDLGSGN